MWVFLWLSCPLQCSCSFYKVSHPKYLYNPSLDGPMNMWPKIALTRICTGTVIPEGVDWPWLEGVAMMVPMCQLKRRACWWP